MVRPYDDSRMRCLSYALISINGSYVVEVNRSRSEKQVTILSGIKVKPGLSAFVDNLEGLGSYISPLISSALAEIPREYVDQTELHIRGTAGMRLLPEDTQLELWDSLYNQLIHHSLWPFRLERSNLGTITGISTARTEFRTIGSEKSSNGVYFRKPGGLLCRFVCQLYIPQN